MTSGAESYIQYSNKMCECGCALIDLVSFGALPPNCPCHFSRDSSVRLATIFLNMQLKDDAFFFSLSPSSLAFWQCYLVLQLLRIVATWFVMAGITLTTTLPQSISIRQPPTCLNVVDPSSLFFFILQTIIFSSHHYPCPSSQSYRELISIFPPPTRVSAP